jgi:hypothetical protein
MMSEARYADFLGVGAVMDIGKSGKKSGHLHPRERRKDEIKFERATPKKFTKTNRSATARPFGFKYEGRDNWATRRETLEQRPWKWVYHVPWYETAQRRDQAMRAWRLHERYPTLYRTPVPVERMADGREKKE